MIKFSIVGIDFSITSPGLYLLNVDKNFNSLESAFAGFTTVKKTALLQRELVLLDKKSWNDDIHRFDILTEEIIDFVDSNTNSDTEVYVGLEGYSYASKGLIFNIAEATGLLKNKLWNNSCNIRIYDPSSIKKFATLLGNADKVMMGDAFVETVDKFKPVLNEGLTNYESPKADIIDAYWICQLLKTELMIRYGMVDMKSLPVKHIEIFNSVSKANKDNLLCRSFISK